MADVGFSSFWRNLFTVVFEVMFGASVTVLVIDRFNEYRATENLRQRLIREAGSRSNDIAISAIEWLRRERWLCGDDGLLKGEFLEGANLRDANLTDTNFEGANLSLSFFQDALLKNVRMRGANLFDASFQGAVLFNADLTSTDLRMAQLGGSILEGAKFQDANMKYVDLQGALLDRNDFGGATLPDGMTFDDDTDMRKYTDPNHHEFRDHYSEKRRELMELAAKRANI